MSETKKEPGDWMPIDAAPKDGQAILGWRDDCGCLLIRWTSVAEFLTDAEIEEAGYNEASTFKEDWFYADFVQGGRLEYSEAPTHWMPLPDGPGVDKGN